MPPAVPVRRRSVRQCVQIGHGHDEERPVRRYDGRRHATPHVHLGEHLLFLARLEDVDVAVLVADVDLAVDDERRGPHGREAGRASSTPGRSSRRGMQEAAEVRDVDETVGDRPPSKWSGGSCRTWKTRPVCVMSPRLVRVDRVEMADAFAVLGVLAVADVDACPGRSPGVEITSLRVFGQTEVLRVRVELPQLLAGRGLVAADPAVALAGDHLIDAADLADRRRRPLAVQNAVPDRIVFPHELAGVLVDRDDRRRLGRRNVHVALVLAVRRADVDQIAPDDRRRVRHVVRIRCRPPPSCRTTRSRRRRAGR